MTPNTVFAGTANRTMTQVSQKAWRASGVVIDDQTAPRPSPKVRTNTTATGSASRSARYPSAANRSAYLARTAFSSSRDSRYPRYEHQGHDEQDDRDRGGRDDVVRLDLAEYEDRGHLRLERDVPGDEDHRAELAERTRKAERDPGEDRGEEIRQDDPPEYRRAPGPERGGRLLHLPIELEQDGLHGSHDERQGHEEQCEQKPDPGVGDVDSERALRSIEREQRQPGDDGGERERQVDERVHDALAAELVPHEDPGDERARDRVDRGDRLRAGDRPPERSEAAIERASDHRGQRQQDDDR